jgi:hypothetical protein
MDPVDGLAITPASGEGGILDVWFGRHPAMPTAATAA